MTTVYRLTFDFLFNIISMFLKNVSVYFILINSVYFVAWRVNLLRTQFDWVRLSVNVW